MTVEHDDSKRRFLKTAAYVAPVIMTLKVTPSLANIGSCDKKVLGDHKLDLHKPDLKGFGGKDFGLSKNDNKQFDLFSDNKGWNNGRHPH